VDRLSVDCTSKDMLLVAKPFKANEGWFNKRKEADGMSDEVRMTGRIVKAGRALAGIGRPDFAAAAGLNPVVLRELEESGSAPVRSAAHIRGLRKALDEFGIILVEEADGLGAGVRLKFQRLDVRQIARLEGEGGITAADDAP